MNKSNKAEDISAARIEERIAAVRHQMGRHVAACLNKDSRAQVRARGFLDKLIQSGEYRAHVDFRRLNGPLSEPETVGVTGIVVRDKSIEVAVYDKQGTRTYVSAMTFVMAVRCPNGSGAPYEGHAFELLEPLTREQIERRYPFASSDVVTRSEAYKAL